MNFRCEPTRQSAQRRTALQKSYLGDALDLAKGAVLSALPNTCLNSLTVAAMCTDAMSWSAEDRETYRLMLRLTTGVPILWTPDAYANDRFKGLPTDARAVFLDPNTGIAPRRSPTHVGVAEVDGLLTAVQPRVVIAYQHSWRARGYLPPILAALTRPSFAYDAGAVAFVYVSNSHELLVHCRSALIASLGTAANRVGSVMEPSSPSDQVTLARSGRR